ncbi:NADH:ubiquinone oxidoreductase 27 kD subunit [Longilinea arvoryzae]|uniref:NADH:ubiquinone oxidoreductase 27 kD subunit n=1 Tax=Longilinea arvoryzae TaxID=360412 RepID=A0A0S7BFB1_9CHLR|nr:NADH-quinone oxidoreductase subunit C [Longilinea arvoryzae]GAP13652.1 NADH:ubiquinone oxidoreductase 27 kD subunit [Longilinea arvoryzae]
MVNDYKTLIESLPGATSLAQRRDGWWMTAPDLDVLEMARKMKEWKARFSTMTGAMISENETAVIYHFCLDCQAYNLKVYTKGNSLPSISNILPAADWIEREIQDLYRVQFKDHPHPERLIRSLQTEPGLFREPGGAAGKSRR